MLNQDIKLDMAHLVLLAVIVVGVLFVTRGCRLECSVVDPIKESLSVVGSSCGSGTVLPRACQNGCRCADCAEACYQRALNGELPGCGGPNPNYDQCNNEYRKCLLHGCDVASGNTCTCPQFYLV